MRIFLPIIILGMLCGCAKNEQLTADYRIVPLPDEITLSADSQPFVLKGSTRIVCTDDSLMREAQFLQEYIEQLTGHKLDINEAAKENYIAVEASLAADSPEAWDIDVDRQRIIVNGATAAGTFQGIQALRKAIPRKGENATVTFPAGQIAAAPLYPYRGVLLDVARHPMEADSVKNFIDMLALHNINILHLHLTDDQGWRLEIKKYPRLAEVGSMRPGTMKGKDFNDFDSIPVSGYYTQEQARDLVQYAAERHITIVPEIDLPGHMVSALSAYPELGCAGGPYDIWQKWGVSEEILCAGNPAVYEFLDDVLTEVMDIFPSKYIHLGGDEVPKVQWENCPKCQAKIRELGLKADAHGSAEAKLQSYVMEQVQKSLKRNGRVMIGWDEILEGGAPAEAVVMSWRGTEGALQAAKQGHDAILTPNTYLYFDYGQSLDRDSEPICIGGYLPVERVYSYEPISSELTADEAKHILGVQANLWREYIKTLSYAQYMVLPRLAALSEVQWVLPEDKDYNDFLHRLNNLIAHYDANGYNYARHIYNVAGELEPDPEQKVLVATLTTMGDQPIHYTLDGSDPTEQSPLYSEPLVIKEPCQLRAVAVAPDGRLSSMYVGDIALSKSSFKPYELKYPAHPNYSGREGALTDGVLGKNAFRMPEWVGIQGKELVATIDMGEPTEVSDVKVRFCVDTGSWIYDARSIQVETSLDGRNFKTVASDEYPALQRHQSQVVEHSLAFGPVQAAYVRVSIMQEKSMPEWHGPGAGRRAFIFIDEISVN